MVFKILPWWSLYFHLFILVIKTRAQFICVSLCLPGFWAQFPPHFINNIENYEFIDKNKRVRLTYNVYHGTYQNLTYEKNN